VAILSTNVKVLLPQLTVPNTDIALEALFKVVLDEPVVLVTIKVPAVIAPDWVTTPAAVKPNVPVPTLDAVAPRLKP
jgi:hypothetical protein